MLDCRWRSLYQVGRFNLGFGNDGEGDEDDEKDDGGEKYGDGEQPGKRAGDSKLMRRRLKWDFRHLHDNDFNVGLSGSGWC